VVVSPDIGSVKMARAYAKRLDADLAIIDKRRPEPNVAEVYNVIGDAPQYSVHHSRRSATFSFASLDRGLYSGIRRDPVEVQDLMSSDS